MQYFPRARVLLPGGHNGNQVQDAGLVGREFQSRKHANVYVHAHIGMCTQHGMPEHVLCARAQHACLAAWRAAERVPITPCMHAAACQP
jgi:hypothetical protein